MKIHLKILFAVEIIITAFLYGILTYFVIYERLSGGVPLRAYILNILLIIFVLSLDYILDHTMGQETFLKKNQSKLKVFFAEFLFFAHFVSYKTALYFFYIAMLIVSRVTSLEPDLISPYLYSYIRSVEYGILLLIPIDKFIEQITLDDKRDKRILKIITRLSKKK